MSRLRFPRRRTVTYGLAFLAAFNVLLVKANADCLTDGQAACRSAFTAAIIAAADAKQAAMDANNAVANAALILCNGNQTCIDLVELAWNLVDAGIQTAFGQLRDLLIAAFDLCNALVAIFCGGGS